MLYSLFEWAPLSLLLITNLHSADLGVQIKPPLGTLTSSLTVQGDHNLKDTVYNCTAADDNGQNATLEVKVDVFGMMSLV